MAIIRSKIARQLLAEGGAPRKGFSAGSNPVNEFPPSLVNEFFMPPAYDFRTTPVDTLYEDMNFKPRQNTEDDESDETTNIFDRTKDFLGSNKQAIGGGLLASALGLGPLGILLGGFIGRRRDQGRGIFESAKARDTRIANEIIAENFRQKQMRKEADRQLGRSGSPIETGSGQKVSSGDLSVGFDTDTGQAFSEYSSPGVAAEYEGSFAGGGIASLQPRQGYFGGKLVRAVTKPFKKAAKAITKVAKSPIGKAALTFGLGSYATGLGPLKNLPGSGFLPFSLPSFESIPGGAATAGIVGASLLGGLLTSKEPEQDINALSERISDQTGIDVAKIREEVQQAYQNKDTSSLAQKYPFLVNQEYSASFATGGRTGFAEGTPKDEVIEEKGLPTLKIMPEFKGDEVKPADMMMASNIENERILENLFEKYLDMGLSPKDAAEKAMEEFDRMSKKQGIKRTMAAEGGMMNLGGNEMDLRGGGFVPIGVAEKADDVPARLSKNEFIFTADAVRAAGGGSVDRGADLMYKTMKQLENKVV